MTKTPRALAGKGEFGLWLYDAVEDRLGDLGAKDFEGIVGDDSTETLTAVAKRLMDVVELSGLEKLAMDATLIMQPRAVRYYSNHLATFNLGRIGSQLDEGLSTGVAFPHNLALALAEAQKSDERFKPELDLTRPSQVLCESWFDDMVHACTRTGNGFWGNDSSNIRSPSSSYAMFQRHTEWSDGSQPFSTGEDGLPTLSPELHDKLIAHTKAYNQTDIHDKSSGCPAAHTVFRPDDDRFGYIGPHAAVYTGENTKPIVDVGVSAVELCTDALRQAYDQVMLNSGHGDVVY